MYEVLKTVYCTTCMYYRNIEALFHEGEHCKKRREGSKAFVNADYIHEIGLYGGLGTKLLLFIGYG